jgi:hypothetical protein
MVLYNKRVKPLRTWDCIFRNGVVSTKHIVHNTEGKVLGEWGMQQWYNKPKESAKRYQHTYAETIPALGALNSNF